MNGAAWQAPPSQVERSPVSEGDQLKLTCQRIASLDQEASRAAAGVKIRISDEGPIVALSRIISAEPRGHNRIVIAVQLPGREVEVGLKETVSLSPKLLMTLRSLPGVVEVEEL